MFQTISSDEFYQKNKQNPLTILDVREADEFATGHIKGAANLPLSILFEESRQLSRDKTYYVVCHSGARSLAACGFLSSEGFQVTNVLGGMTTWKGEISK